MKKFLLASLLLSGVAFASITVGSGGRVVCSGGCSISGGGGNWRVCDSGGNCIYMKVRPVPAY